MRSITLIATEKTWAKKAFRHWNSNKENTLRCFWEIRDDVQTSTWKANVYWSSSQFYTSSHALNGATKCCDNHIQRWKAHNFTIHAIKSHPCTTMYLLTNPRSFHFEFCSDVLPQSFIDKASVRKEIHILCRIGCVVHASRQMFGLFCSVAWSIITKEILVAAAAVNRLAYFEKLLFGVISLQNLQFFLNSLSAFHLSTITISSKVTQNKVLLAFFWETFCISTQAAIRRAPEPKRSADAPASSNQRISKLLKIVLTSSNSMAACYKFYCQMFGDGLALFGMCASWGCLSLWWPTLQHFCRDL